METLIDTRRDSGLEGYPIRREKTMMTTCSSNQIYLYLSHYISFSIHGNLVWIQATWCRASHVQQKHGEKFLWHRKYIKIVLQKLRKPLISWPLRPRTSSIILPFLEVTLKPNWQRYSSIKAEACDGTKVVMQFKLRPPILNSMCCLNWLYDGIQNFGLVIKNIY
jgi:hypothetical protein